MINDEFIRNSLTNLVEQEFFFENRSATGEVTEYLHF